MYNRRLFAILLILEMKRMHNCRNYAKYTGGLEAFCQHEQTPANQAFTAQVWRKAFFDKKISNREEVQKSKMIFGTDSYVLV
ncbi:hypothetical protein BC351_20415 [Paenibacillus ferrarius]|uniref:Uncharacterized protein n=1 Tax=Paenibacillus ferrarius TaxID=1469647 RepID=A0A1V4HNC5_9BACL|nr:hypothetical protein BC351_20415 [Paenibacillus ferrarius]